MLHWWAEVISGHACCFHKYEHLSWKWKREKDGVPKYAVQILRVWLCIIHTHSRTYTCTCAHIHTHAKLHSQHACALTLLLVHGHAHSHTHTYVRTHTHTHSLTLTLTLTLTHTHTHTHTHVHVHVHCVSSNASEYTASVAFFLATLTHLTQHTRKDNILPWSLNQTTGCPAHFFLQTWRCGLGVTVVSVFVE